MDTKIIATVGPASLNEKTIQKMDVFGVDLFRINLSHTNIEDFEPLVKVLRGWTDIQICPDTEGAQLRTGILAGNQINLNDNNEISEGSDEGSDDEIIYCPPDPSSK